MNRVLPTLLLWFLCCTSSLLADSFYPLTYGPTQEAESLHDIAKVYAESSSLSAEQWMIILWRENKKTFYAQNMFALKPQSQLKAPQENALNPPDQGYAQALVEAHRTHRLSLEETLSALTATTQDKADTTPDTTAQSSAHLSTPPGDRLPVTLTQDASLSLPSKDLVKTHKLSTPETLQAHHTNPLSLKALKVYLQLAEASSQAASKVFDTYLRFEKALPQMASRALAVYQHTVQPQLQYAVQHTTALLHYSYDHLPSQHRITELASTWNSPQKSFDLALLFSGGFAVIFAGFGLRPRSKLTSVHTPNHSQASSQAAALTQIPQSSTTSVAKEFFQTTEDSDFDLFACNESKFVKVHLAKAYSLMNQPESAKKILQEILETASEGDKSHHSSSTQLAKTMVEALEKTSS